MTQAYNPIVRTFGQLRAALVATTGTARRDVRPGTPLDDLLPVRYRRELWHRLRQDRPRVPALELPPAVRALVVWAVPVGAVAAALWSWELAALLTAVPLGWKLYHVSRPWAVEFPLGLRTVGELALYLTHFGDHRDSGYRWTHAEVTMKVRMIVAESVGLRLDQVRPESSLIELGMD
ncbi:MAG TPA: hypothetical protein VGF55_15450 [Gemmataceae bacterium]|jgi:hypothetical protein